MKIVQASGKRVYEIEGKPVLRALSSGIKLTDYMMEAMGLVQGDKVSYAQDADDSNRIYLYKTDGESGSILGATKAFTNAGLMSKLKMAANAPALETKGGHHIVFLMDTDATEFDGVDYFGLTFSKVELGSEDEEEVTESTEETFE